MDAKAIDEALRTVESNKELLSSLSDDTTKLIKNLEDEKENAKASAKSKAERESYVKAAKAAQATTLAVINSMDKLQSGDPAQISVGVMDIMASFSQFAAVTGPQGAVFAAVFGSVCSIVGAVVGASANKKSSGQGKESPMTKVYNVFKVALEEAHKKEQFEERTNDADGVLAGLVDDYNTITTYSEGSDPLTESEKNNVLDHDYLLKDETVFCAELMGDIVKGLTTEDPNEADRIVTLISYYATLSQMMIYNLFKFAALCNDEVKIGERAVATQKIAMNKIETIISGAKEKLGHLLKEPDEASCIVYTRLHVSLSPEQRADIESLLCQKFEGETRYISNIYDGQRHDVISYNGFAGYLNQDKTFEERVSARIGDLAHLSLFRIFQKPDDPYIKIFGFGAAGYIMPREGYDWVKCAREASNEDQMKWKQSRMISSPQSLGCSILINKSNGLTLQPLTESHGKAFQLGLPPKVDPTQFGGQYWHFFAEDMPQTSNWIEPKRELVPVHDPKKFIEGGGRPMPEVKIDKKQQDALKAAKKVVAIEQDVKKDANKVLGALGIGKKKKKKRKKIKKGRRRRKRR